MVQAVGFEPTLMLGLGQQPLPVGLRLQGLIGRDGGTRTPNPFFVGEVL